MGPKYAPGGSVNQLRTCSWKPEVGAFYHTPHALGGVFRSQRHSLRVVPAIDEGNAMSVEFELTHDMTAP